MSKAKTITITDATRKHFLKMIQYHFETTHDQQIGELAASFMLDFILDEMGPIIYNQAIEDAHAHLTEKLDDLFEIQKHTR